MYNEAKNVFLAGVPYYVKQKSKLQDVWKSDIIAAIERSAIEEKGIEDIQIIKGIAYTLDFPWYQHNMPQWILQLVLSK